MKLFSAEEVGAIVKEQVEAAVLAEREACAKVCEELGTATNGIYERNHDCAAAIRARGEK